MGFITIKNHHHLGEYVWNFFQAFHANPSKSFVKKTTAENMAGPKSDTMFFFVFSIGRFIDQTYFEICIPPTFFFVCL